MGVGGWGQRGGGGGMEESGDVDSEGEELDADVIGDVESENIESEGEENGIETRP